MIDGVHELVQVHPLTDIMLSGNTDGYGNHHTRWRRSSRTNITIALISFSMALHDQQL